MKHYKTVLFHSNLKLSEQSNMKSDFQEDINVKTEKKVVTNHSQILVDILNVLKYKH